VLRSRFGAAALRSRSGVDLAGEWREDREREGEPYGDEAAVEGRLGDMMRLTAVVWGWWTMGDDRAVVGALAGAAALSGALRE